MHTSDGRLQMYVSLDCCPCSLTSPSAHCLNKAATSLTDHPVHVRYAEHCPSSIAAFQSLWMLLTTFILAVLSSPQLPATASDLSSTSDPLLSSTSKCGARTSHGSMP